MRYASVHQLLSHRDCVGLEEQCSEYRHQDWGWVRLARRGLPERLVGILERAVAAARAQPQLHPSGLRAGQPAADLGRQPQRDLGAAVGAHGERALGQDRLAAREPQLAAAAPGAADAAAQRDRDAALALRRIGLSLVGRVESFTS